MFNRQKALLEVVRLAGGTIDRIVLTKWAFLVRHETASRGGDSFYDFVPYQYGPFSFALYQEADKLVALGYLRQQGSSGWALGNVPAPSVDQDVRQDLALITSRFCESPVDDLLDYVYEKYPHFTTNSKRKQLAKRLVAPLAVYTAGYEGKSIDAFLNGLTETGIAHLIDVRMNPIARRYGFHRSTLERLSGHLGIRYSHVPSLGIASKLRQQVDTIDDYQVLFSQYESTTLKTQHAAVKAVSGWIGEAPSVLMCMEAQPSCCHRSRLAKLVSRTTGFPIIHLG